MILDVKAMQLPLGNSLEVSHYLEMILAEYNYSREMIVHYCFLLEEALIHWRENFPADHTLNIVRHDTRGFVRFEISLEGEMSDPFEAASPDPEDDAADVPPLDRMHDLLLAGVGSEFRYRYKKGCNCIRAYFPKANVKKNIFANNFLLLAIPIILQTVLNSTASYTDAFMLSFLNADSMSAVSLMTEFISLYSFLLMAAGGAMSALIAQLWGKRNRRQINSVVSITLTLTLGCGLIFTLATALFPYPIASIFTNVESIRLEGALYLQILAPNFLFTAIFSLMFGIFRIMGEVKTAMKIGIIGCGINVLLNAILIFGLFGIQPLGVAGAAAATLAGSAFQCVACLIYNQKKRIVSFKALTNKATRKQLRSSFLHLFAPLLGQCFSYKIANLIILASFGHLGSDILAAYSILSILSIFLFCVKSGIGAASGVMVGKALGRNDKEEALWTSKQTLRIGGRISVVCAILFFLLGMCTKLLPLDLSATAQSYLTVMIIAFSINFFLAELNGILLDGALFAGGDSKAVLIIDSIVMWCILVPIALLGPTVFGLPVLAMAILLKIDEILKFPAFFLRYKKNKWLRVLVDNEKT